MLTTLRIKNLALVADLTLELRPRYNVITGETGAGKSIIIGALNLVLGERADRTLIRTGAESCSVEALFDVKKLRAPLTSFLEENGLEACEDHQLVLKRSFTAAGANRQFVNGSPTTLTALASIGEWLVDMHGPHDHQSLLHPAKQLILLDAFGGLENEREAFGELIRRRAAFESEKAGLIVDEATYDRQLDLLHFQVNEIEAARFEPDEEERVAEEHHRASNVAKLMQLSQSALDALSESEASLITQAGVIGRALQELARVDSSAAPLVELHRQAVGMLGELQSEISRYADKVEVEPARLAELEERINLIHSLKRKYGATLAEVIAYAKDARRKLQSLESRDAELTRLNVALKALEGEILKAGRALSVKRKKLIPQLAKAVGKQLAELGFSQSRFGIELEPVTRPRDTLSPRNGERDEATGTSFSSSGFDAVEFRFSPNLGEPLKPLPAIASSGEIARVMLAIKTVLATEDEVPVLVFDEVDANVGGETANAVGEKMKQISEKRQVICITHLPQVAAPADAHYVVTKQVKEDRTISEIRLLEPSSRVSELARMLGGQSDAARKHAEALLG